MSDLIDCNIRHDTGQRVVFTDQMLQDFLVTSEQWANEVYGPHRLKIEPRRSVRIQRRLRSWRDWTKRRPYVWRQRLAVKIAPWIVDFDPWYDD